MKNNGACGNDLIRCCWIKNLASNYKSIVHQFNTIHEQNRSLPEWLVMQDRKKLFHDGGLRNAIMVGRRRKILKLHWLKDPKTVQKNEILDHKINDSKPHNWSSSSNFKFSGRKFQSQQKLEKNITHFTIQFRSKTSLILKTSTNSTL